MPLTHSLTVQGAEKKGKERWGKALSFSLKASVREPEQEGNPTKSAVCSAWRGVKWCHRRLWSSCRAATGGIAHRKRGGNMLLLWNSVQIIHPSRRNMKGTRARLKHVWKPVGVGYLIDFLPAEYKNSKLFIITLSERPAASLTGCIKKTYCMVPAMFRKLWSNAAFLALKHESDIKKIIISRTLYEFLVTFLVSLQSVRCNTEATFGS